MSRGCLFDNGIFRNSRTYPSIIPSSEVFVTIGPSRLGVKEKDTAHPEPASSRCAPGPAACIHSTMSFTSGRLDFRLRGDVGHADRPCLPCSCSHRYR
jgi:hypothetical protein